MTGVFSNSEQGTRRAKELSSKETFGGFVDLMKALEINDVVGC